MAEYKEEVVNEDIVVATHKEFVPKKSWTKNNMMSWLEDEGINYPKDAFKKVLWELILKHK